MRNFALFFRAVWVLVGSLALLAACGYSEEEMQAKVREIDGLRADAREAAAREAALNERLSGISAQNAAMGARLEALGQDVSELETQRGALESDLAQTRRALDELRTREAQAQERLRDFRSMIERFREMIASGRLRVRIVRNRMVVELPENILFDSGEAVLKPEGEQALAQVAQVLRTITGRDFQVAGHTDNVPIRSRRFPSNWELSTSRSVNVARYIISQGVDAAHVSAAGHADTQPVSTNETPEGRQQNRRIEIVLLPNLNELPDLSSLETAGAQ